METNQVNLVISSMQNSNISQLVSSKIMFILIQAHTKEPFILEQIIDLQHLTFGGSWDINNLTNNVNQ